jgi:hypothetical protein
MGSPYQAVGARPFFAPKPPRVRDGSPEKSGHGTHGDNDDKKQLHGHHPGQVAGEGARSANHLSHGAEGLKAAAREAEALKLAAQEAAAAQQASEAFLQAGHVASSAEAVRDEVKVSRAASAAHRVAAAAKALKEVDGLAEAVPAEEVKSISKAARSPHLEAHKVGVMGRVLGLIGVAGGGIQMISGVSQIRNGEKADGVKNLVVGAGFAGSGVAELTLATKLASRVAAPLAGGASAIDGAYDVVMGVRKHDGRKIALGTAKAAGGAMLAASPFLGGTLAGAPLGIVLAITGTTLVAGAALIESWPTLTRWASEAIETMLG